MIIGSHVSFRKEDQLVGSVKEALSYDAKTFMFYTGAPQNTNRAAIDPELTNLGQKEMKKEGIDIEHVIIHAPYIINMANAKNEEFNIRFLTEEIKRAQLLGVSKIVIHPGSHVGFGVEAGIENIATCLNMSIDPKMSTEILLETMAGKGTEIGRTFEEIKAIIDLVHESDKIKVCMDTCHMHDAGYDVTNFDQLLDEFDRVIGLEKLACIHINDSKNDIEAHKDRHANFGYGKIGFEHLIEILWNKRVSHIPKILETPYVSNTEERIYPPYKFEIDMIRKKQFNENLIEDIVAYYKA